MSFQQVYTWELHYELVLIYLQYCLHALWKVYVYI